MLQHYLRTALRGLVRHKLYSFINIAGLSIGLAAAILIVLYVRYELSYDKWIPHTSHLYRLEATFHIPGLPVTPFAMASFPVVTAIGEKSPQVKAVTHVLPESMTVIVGQRDFRERVTFVDSNFFRVIELPLARGDPAQVLAQPESVVISQRIARKYFGDVDPIGKILVVSRTPSGTCDATDSTCRSGLYPLTVTGVLRDLPRNTQLLAELVVPNTSQADRLSPQEKEQSWMSLEGDYGYLELRPGADPGAVLAELKPILDASWNPHAIGVDRRASEVEQYRLTLFLDVHLASDKYGGMTAGGSWATVYGLAAIALLIVLIACFNFINLATARATLRAREIALRKVMGARRRQLIAQFLLEAVLMALVSLGDRAISGGGPAAALWPVRGQHYRPQLSRRLAPARCPHWERDRRRAGERRVSGYRTFRVSSRFYSEAGSARARKFRPVTLGAGCRTVRHLDRARHRGARHLQADQLHAKV